MMANWWGRKPLARVPTDIVVPLRYWDDTVILKNTVVFCMSKYDAAMDAEKLYMSLERLVARKGWRKLGARLRKNTRGEFEYHIPAEFTKERPAVTFSQDRHNISVNEHPLASQLPRPSTRPAVVGDPVKFTPLTRPPGTPSSLDDYLNQDRGQVGLHIVSFTDTTLISLYYLHTTFDLMGWGTLMKAWTHELHGREDQIQTPLLGGDPEDSEDFDPMRKLGTNPIQPHVLAGRQMGLASLIRFGIRNVYNFLWRKKECRIVCIPGAFVDRMRAQALDELKAEAVKTGNSQGTPLFLSHGDVLTAWWARLLVSQLLPADSKRTVVIQNAASARKALSGHFETAARPYVSNLFTFLYSLIPASDLIARPVSWLAQQIRHTIMEQGTTRGQVEAYYALQRQTPGRTIPIFGDAGMHMLIFSNWSKAGFYGHDFSPARVDAADETPLYPSYIQAVQLPLEFPEGTLIIGQDQAGNYWMYGFRAKGLWAKVEQALKETDY